MGLLFGQSQSCGGDTSGRTLPRSGIMLVMSKHARRARAVSSTNRAGGGAEAAGLADADGEPAPIAPLEERDHELAARTGRVAQGGRRDVPRGGELPQHLDESVERVARVVAVALDGLHAAGGGGAPEYRRDVPASEGGLEFRHARRGEARAGDLVQHERDL